MEAWADAGLAAAARSALLRIRGVLPGPLRSGLDDAVLFALGIGRGREASQHLELLRTALTVRKRLELVYCDEHGVQSHRTVRPLALYFWGTSWTLAAWCELRADFRTFRPDRIAQATLGDRFDDEPGKDRAAFLQSVTRCEPLLPGV